jgi:predicted ATP-grasp superfamily ATP-dependent carboligase
MIGFVWYKNPKAILNRVCILLLLCFVLWSAGLIFLSDAQPDLTKAEDYCRQIITLVKTFKVKTVISFAAMPQAIDHSQEPHVWFTATSQELINNLNDKSSNPLQRFAYRILK